MAFGRAVLKGARDTHQWGKQFRLAGGGDLSQAPERIDSAHPWASPLRGAMKSDRVKNDGRVIFRT